MTSAPAVRPLTMTALCATAAGAAVRTDYPVPLPAANEALLRVRLAGICSTDLHILRGYKGGFRGVLGHEFVADVMDAPGYPEWVGRRVVAEINIGCGNCGLCAQGLAKHCRSRQALGITGHDGAFADYLTAPIANLHAVDPAIPDEAAVFTEPLAAALRMAEQVHLKPGSRCYVLGDGRLGQLSAQVLALSCPAVTLIGRTRAKLQLAAARGIAVAMPDELAGLRSHPADVVVEATGTPEGFALALDLVRPLGTIVLKSTFGDPVTSDLSRLAVDEMTVVGSRCGPFAPALALLASGGIDPLPLISARFALRDGLKALEAARSKGVIKVLLVPTG